MHCEESPYVQAEATVDRSRTTEVQRREMCSNVSAGKKLDIKMTSGLNQWWEVGQTAYQVSATMENSYRRTVVVKQIWSICHMTEMSDVR